MVGQTAAIRPSAPPLTAPPRPQGGLSIGTQIGFATAGCAVAFAAEIAGPGGDDWAAAALFTALLRLPPTLAALSARETHTVPSALLGERATLGGPHPETVSA